MYIALFNSNQVSSDNETEFPGRLQTLCCTISTVYIYIRSIFSLFKLITRLCQTTSQLVESNLHLFQSHINPRIIGRRNSNDKIFWQLLSRCRNVECRITIGFSVTFILIGLIFIFYPYILSFLLIRSQNFRSHAIGSSKITTGTFTFGDDLKNAPWTVMNPDVSSLSFSPALSVLISFTPPGGKKRPIKERDPYPRKFTTWLTGIGVSVAAGKSQTEISCNAQTRWRMEHVKIKQDTRVFWDLSISATFQNFPFTLILQAVKSARPESLNWRTSALFRKKKGEGRPVNTLL